MDIYKLEIIIQLCRIQVQREREKLMLPAVRGLASSLAKLKSAVEDDAKRLQSRIDTAAVRADRAFQGSHGALDALEGGVKEVEDFISGLERSNGGDPLDSSEEPSNVSKLPPRSSEVA